MKSVIINNNRGQVIMHNAQLRWLKYSHNVNESAKINLNYISVFSDMYWTGSYNRQLADTKGIKGPNVLITLQQLGLVSSIDGIKYVPTTLGRQYITDLFRNRYVPKNVDKNRSPLWYVIFSIFGINQCDGHNYIPSLGMLIIFGLMLIETNVLKALGLDCGVGATLLMLNLMTSITHQNISGIKPFNIFKCYCAEIRNNRCTLDYFIKFLNRHHINFFRQGMVESTLNTMLPYGMFEHQSLWRNIWNNSLSFRNKVIGLVSFIVRQVRWN